MTNQAIELLKQLLDELDPKDALFSVLVDTLQKEGQFDYASTVLQKAIAANPDDLTLRQQLAENFFARGQISACLEVIEDLLRIPHAYPTDFLLMAANAYEKENQQDKARELRRRARSRRSVSDDARPASSGSGAQAAEIPFPGFAAESFQGTQDTGATNDLIIEDTGLSLADVGGMDNVKETIRRKMLLLLERPEILEAYGKSAGGGVLMYGPPGCGKTYIARAIAGERGIPFISLGLHDILDMYIGQSEQNLHRIFQSARDNAPAVLFFDEVDALGANRSDMRYSSGRNIINQFLSELDGVEFRNDNLLILAATNAPWHVDAAFRRPGRFDRILFIPPPDAAAREAILEIHLRGKPADNIDLKKVAKKTDEYSGADLKAIVDTALEAKIDLASVQGEVVPLATSDLLDARKQIKPSTKSWWATARNYALYSNESGLYDEVLAFLGKKK